MKSFQNITKNAELHTFEMNVSVFMKYTISVFHDHNYFKTLALGSSNQRHKR